MNTEEARQKLLRAALRVLSAEHAEETADAAAEAEHAVEQLALAARDLTRATDALPNDKQPAGW